MAVRGGRQLNTTVQDGGTSADSAAPAQTVAFRGGGLSALFTRPAPSDDVSACRVQHAFVGKRKEAGAGGARQRPAKRARAGARRAPPRRGVRGGRTTTRVTKGTAFTEAAADSDGDDGEDNDCDQDDEGATLDGTNGASSLRSDVRKMRVNGARREQRALIERAAAAASDPAAIVGAGRVDAFRRAAATAAAHVAVRSVHGVAVGEGASGGDDDAAAAAVVDRSRTTDDFIAECHRLAVEHDEQRESVRRSLANVDRALETFRRTAHNVSDYKRLIERREILHTQLIALDQSAPVAATGGARSASGAFQAPGASGDAAAVVGGALSTSAVAAMYERVGEFALYEAETGSAPAPGDTMDALRARRGAQLRVDDDAIGADAHSNARMPRRTEVTFAAPLFSAAADASLRAALRATLAAKQATLAAGGAPTGDAEVLRAFERDVGADVARYAIDSVVVLAHVVAPRAIGAIAPTVADDVPSGVDGAAATASLLRAHQRGAARRQRERDVCPDLYNDPMLTAAQRKRIDNRLKASRGTSSAAMSDFFDIARDAPVARADDAHVPLVNYLGARHCTQSAAPSVHYDDPTCTECGGALETDFRTGAETCTRCYATAHSGVAHPLHALHNPTQSKFEYLRGGHMAMILKRFQGLESTVIPRKKVLEPVLLRLHEQNVPLHTVTVMRIKRTLRALRLTKWYEHVHQLHYIVTGRKPHRFTPLQVQEFLGAFECLIEPYERHRPPNSDNFPYYYYALHKLAQLLGHPPRVVNAFPMFKNKKRHRDKERIWEKMMADLGWPYISS